MSELILTILSGLIIAVSNAIEGITGFGSTVLALPFLNLTSGLKNSVILLCIFGWLISAYIIFRSWKDIELKEFCRIISWCAPGVPVGLLLFRYLAPEILCILLGAFMIYAGISGWHGMKSIKAMPSAEDAKKSILLKLALFAGGIIQGAFGTGGPFVVIYATRVLKNKALFRITLSLLWFTINSTRLAIWGVQGVLSDIQLWKLAAFITPFWLAGAAAGDYLHSRVSEYHFKLGVYALLAIAGVVMLLNNLLKVV